MALVAPTNTICRSTMTADPSTPTRTALAQFYTDHGLGPDGGISDRWVRVRIVGPVSVYFPNFESRKRSVLLHDLHHIATGYGTTLLCEAEIAAWEIGGSCADHPAAWVLNTAGLLYGIPLSPRRTMRAFVRGRQTGNLYGREFDGAVLEGTVSDLRRRVGVDAPERSATGADVRAFVVWAAAVMAFDLAGAAGVVMAVVWVVRMVGG